MLHLLRISQLCAAGLCCLLSCSVQLPRITGNTGREMILFKYSLRPSLCFLSPNMSMFHSWICFFFQNEYIAPYISWFMPSLIHNSLLKL